MHIDLPEHIASHLFSLARLDAKYSEILQAGIRFNIDRETLVVYLWNLIPQYRMSIILNEEDYSGVPRSDLLRSLQSYDQRDFESLSKTERKVASILAFDEYADNPPDSLTVEERCLLFKFHKDLPKWRYDRAILRSYYESETLSHLASMTLVAGYLQENAKKRKVKRSLFFFAEDADAWVLSGVYHMHQWLDLDISLERARVLERFGIEPESYPKWVFSIIERLSLDEFGEMNIVFALFSFYPKHIKTEDDLRRRVQGFLNLNADFKYAGRVEADENRAVSFIDSGVLNSELAYRLDRLNIAYDLRYEHALRLSAKMDARDYIYIDEFLKKHYGVEETD